MRLHGGLVDRYWPVLCHAERLDGTPHLQSLPHQQHPAVPRRPPLSFETTSAPKNGTPLAATGCAVHICDFLTGMYKHHKSIAISGGDGTPAPHVQTGLSVALLGEQEGYRVFYQDRSKALQSLKYTQVGSWSYGGPISININRSGMAIMSMFLGFAMLVSSCRVTLRIWM
ncbi:hypothetical protein VTI74DRAFT_11448 [Chaetomium olivicolor]